MNPSETPSQYVVDSFRRFFSLLPRSRDKELTILKGHLLVEEQLRRLISERLKNPEPFKQARFGFHQCVYLAQSLYPPDYDPWIWEAALNLNKVRNDIAHQLEPKELTKGINKFIKSHPSGFAELADQGSQFDLVLWALFTALSQLAEKPSARVLALVTGNERQSN